MSGCSGKISDTCGKKHNAKCITYEGDLHANTELENCDCHNLEDVIEDLNLAIDNINEAIDLSGLGDDCLDYDLVDGILLVKNALKKFEEEICDIKDILGTNTGCDPVFTADISCVGLDFECLSDACGSPISNLKELLQALITQSCQNKTDISTNHP